MLMTYLKLTCVPILWGGTFIAGRIISAHLTPATAGLIRFMFALTALLLTLKFTEGFGGLRRLSPKQWLGSGVLGATGIFAYNLFFFSALAILPASRCSMIVALSPVMTLLLARIAFNEKLTRRKTLGTVIALLGVWIVITRGDLSQLLVSVGQGELLMFGAITSWAAYTLVSKTLLTGLSPLLTTTLAITWGSVFLALTAIFEFPKVSLASFIPEVWLSLLFLGVLGTAVAFVWYNQAIQKLGAQKTVVFNNLVPIFGVVFGWALLNEPLTSSLVLGGFIAVLGVFIVNSNIALPKVNP
jgi:drug/metabolite transporter (DMT)-like permease